MKSITISQDDAQQLFEAIPENLSDALDDLAMAVNDAAEDAKSKGAPISITLTIAAEENEDDE